MRGVQRTCWICLPEIHTTGKYLSSSLLKASLHLEKRTEATVPPKWRTMWYSGQFPRQPRILPVTHFCTFSSMPFGGATTQHISRLLTGKSNTLAAILKWIDLNFPGLGENYVLANSHPKTSKKCGGALRLSTAIFPRKTPIGTTEVMPVCFILDK